MRNPVLLVAVGLVVAACSGGVPRGWQEPDEYVFTVDAGCGLRAFSGRYTVHVVDGAVVEHAALDGRGGHMDLSNDQVPTMADIARRYREAKADPDARATIVTDPDDGHPVAVDIDWIVNAIDDEECYRVSDYVPGPP